MMAEISCGAYSRSPSRTLTSSPIFRLIERTVRSGARTHWLRAGVPTSKPALRVQADDRRQNGLAVGADHLGPAVANDGDLAVGRSQIDADDRFHHRSLLDC